MIISKWAYILIGDDRAGKTTFQKHLMQEKMGEYQSVENYFNHYFKDADIAILSSHVKWQ